MKALVPPLNKKMNWMDEDERSVKRIKEEFVKFERTLEELRFLKDVAEDLRSFRKMIRLKRYD
jgi:hypothetical protein